MGVFLRNKTQNPVFLPYPYRGMLLAGGRVAVNLTEQEAYDALAIVPGEKQNVISVEAGAIAPFNDLVKGDAENGLLIGALQNPLPLQNVVFVENLGDFPSPSAGVITLSANTLYVINGAVDILGNRLVRAADTQIEGFSSPLRDTITSSNVGSLISNLGGNSTPFEIGSVGLISTAGDIFDIAGAPARFWVSNCILSGEYGASAGSRQRFVNCAFVDFNAGMKFSAGGLILSIEGCSFEQASAGTGVCIDLGLNVWTDAILISNNLITPAAGGTGLNGLTGNGNVAAALGAMDGNVVGVAGTGLVGITADDVRWLFNGNIGALLNTSFLGQYGFSGSPTTTPTTAAFTKILGTTVAGLQKRFVHVADNRMDYVGIETGSARIDVSIGASKTGGQSIEYEFAVFKNAAQVGPGFPMIVNNQGNTVSFSVVNDPLVITDSFDVRVRNLDNLDALGVIDLSVLLTKI